MTAPRFDSLKAGDAIPSFVRVTDLAHWNRYAAVNDEFIPIHMDPADAIAAGQKDVFGMGNLRTSYLHNALRDWLGESGDIVAYDCQFRGFNYKHDRLECGGVVTGTEVRDGAKLAHLELFVTNQDGDNTCPGHATVRLFDGAAAVMPEPDETPVAEGREPGVYLDQATIDRLGTLGKPRESLPIGENEIRRWAIAIHYPEPSPPEFQDEAIAEKGPWGGFVAPREFNPFAWLPRQFDTGLPQRPVSNEPGHRILNGGTRLLYFEPMRPGDRITSVSRQVDAYEKEGRLGTMLFSISESRWTNQRGQLVRLAYSTGIYY